VDVSYTEAQQLLQDTARDFVEREFSTARVREMRADGVCHDPDLWIKLASLGWVGLPFDEAYGGSGGGWVDLTVLLEELGRGLLPGPFLSTVLSGLVIDRYGTPDQKARLLPKIASGQTNVALALLEPRATFDDAGVQVRATATDDGFRLDGVKHFVRDAHDADFVLVAARDERGEVGFYLADARDRGFNLVHLDTIGHDCQSRLEMSGVAVARDDLIGTPAGASANTIADVASMGALMECAYTVGMMARPTEMTIEYAKTRVQFGRPIGSFQAVQHQVADMVTDLDGARLITSRAASALDEGLDASADIGRAKAWVGESSVQVLRKAHQIHGGLAHIVDVDLYLYYERAKAAELMFGQPSDHLDAVAAALLD